MQLLTSLLQRLAAAIAIFLPIEASIPAGNLNEGGHHLKSPKTQNKTLTSCLRLGAAPAKHVGDIWGIKELVGVTPHEVWGRSWPR